MAESPEVPDGADLFRWQALFQRSREPLFLLNGQRRILFVNRAWEQLTGVAAGQARGLLCKRYRNFEAAPLRVLASALSPPPEVLAGEVSRARRQVPGPQAGRRWWDIHFFPLQGDQGLLGIVGKLVIRADTDTPALLPLPEKLAVLRERLAQRFRLDHLASEVPALHRVAEQVRCAAQTPAAVLITGERGTGKQWLARTIHHHGISRDRAFVSLDCAGLPPRALSAALFGAGDLARRPGVGTIYLRNLSDLPRELQTQLHGWLAEPDAGRPRVIASLTGDARQEVQDGRLLEELFCSVGTFSIELPPLRQRRSDLPLLVQRLLERASTGAAKRVADLTAEAWAVLRAYSWPGNLRELNAVLLAARNRAQGDTIGVADLPAYVQQLSELDRIAGRSPERPLPLDQLMEQVERRLIVLALKMAKGNKSRAAKLLSIWRPRLLRRMKELGIPDG